MFTATESARNCSGGIEVCYVFLCKANHCCRNTFTQYGQIVNISMEVEKNCGFITYERVESAEKSIAELNGTQVTGIQLKVSLARRQPVIDPINDASSSSTWSTIAASHSQKGSHKDKREMVTYDEDIF